MDIKKITANDIDSQFLTQLIGKNKDLTDVERALANGYISKIDKITRSQLPEDYTKEISETLDKLKEQAKNARLTTTKITKSDLSENLRQELQSMNSILDNLQSRSYSVVIDTSGASGGSTTSNNRISSLESSVSDLKLRLSQAESSISNNEQNVTTNKTELKNLQSEITGNTTAINANKKQLDTMDTFRTDTSNTLSNMDTSIENVSLDVKILDNRVGAAEEKVKALEQRVDTSSTSQLEEKMNRLDTSLAAVTTKVNTNAGTISSLDELAEKNKKDVQSLGEKIDTNTANISALSTSLESTKADLNTQIANQTSTISQSVSDHSASIKKLQEDSTSQNASLNSLSTRASELEGNLSKAKQDLANEISARENLLNRYNITESYVSTNVGNLLKDMADATSTMETNKKDINERVDSIKESVDELQANTTIDSVRSRIFSESVRKIKEEELGTALSEKVAQIQTNKSNIESLMAKDNTFEGTNGQYLMLDETKHAIPKELFHAAYFFSSTDELNALKAKKLTPLINLKDDNHTMFSYDASADKTDGKSDGYDTGNTTWTNDHEYVNSFFYDDESGLVYYLTYNRRLVLICKRQQILEKTLTVAANGGTQVFSDEKLDMDKAIIRMVTTYNNADYETDVDPTKVKCYYSDNQIIIQNNDTAAHSFRIAYHE